jgi:hypothetical protein
MKKGRVDYYNLGKLENKQNLNHFINVTSNNTSVTTNNNSNNKELDFKTLNTSPLLKVGLFNLEKKYK